MNLKMLQLPQLPQLLQLLVWLCCVLPLAAPARWQPESTCNLMTKSLMDLYGQLKLRPLLGGDQKFLKDTSGALMQFQLCADPSVCFSDRQNILVKDEDDEEYEDTAADDDNDDDNKCEHDNDEEEEEEEPEEEQGEDQEQDQDLDDDDDDDGSFMERVSCIIKGLHESSRAIADDLKDLEAQLQGRLEKQKQDAGQDTESAGADEEEQTTPDECTNQQSAEEEGQGEGEVDKSTEECEKCEEDAGGEPQQKDDSEEEEQQQEDECEVDPKEVPEKIPDMDPPPNSQKCPLTMADDDDESAEPENDYDNDMDNDNDMDMDMDMDMDTDMDMDMDMEMEPDAEPEQSDMYPLLQLLKYEQQPLQSAKASPCLAQKLCGESSLWDDDLAMEGHCHGSADPDDCLDSDWETDLYNFYC